MPTTGPADRNTGGNNFVSKVLTNVFVATTAFTFTPGTSGVAWAVTPPFKLALLTTIGSDTANGTEATTGTCPGYTTLASGSAPSMTWSYSAGIITTTNAQSYSSITGSWASIVGIEVWDNAGTKLRYLQSAYSGSTFSTITGITTGDTVQFPISAITYDASGW